jgi:hypothetical protein
MAILATEKILTLDYWKPAYKLEVGDYVFNRDGKLVRVKLVQEYRAEECYEVMFNDYLSVSGDQHLTLPVEDKTYRNQIHRYKNKKKFRKPLKLLKVIKLQTLPLLDRRQRSALSTPTAKPLEFPHQTLPIPPFIFGFWFFNRRANKVLTSPKGYKEHIYQQFQDAGYKITEHRKVSNGERSFSVYPTIESQLVPNIPNTIPNNYLLASSEQRLELLRGIMYSKARQYLKCKDRFRFSTQYRSISLRVQGLLESMGLRTNVTLNEARKTYTIFFKSRLKLMEHQESPPVKVHISRRYIKKITPIQGQLCVHIETDDPNTGFLVGEGFIACH